MENYSQLVALSVIHTAREYGYLDGPLTVIEKLADLEKNLFIAILKQIKIHLQREQRTELSAEEIISLYTFILAKAAEAVSNSIGKNDYELDLAGMLDGKIPFYSDPALENFCHKSLFPAEFARGFHEFYSHYGEALAKEGVQPVLILAESLKWTWRIAIHVCYGILEKNGRNK